MPEEWQDCLGHFELRELALGECGRAYGTDCNHEHARVRCPVLVMRPSDRPALGRDERKSPETNC